MLFGNHRKSRFLSHSLAPETQHERPEKDWRSCLCPCSARFSFWSRGARDLPLCNLGVVRALIATMKVIIKIRASRPVRSEQVAFSRALIRLCVSWGAQFKYLKRKAAPTPRCGRAPARAAKGRCRSPDAAPRPLPDGEPRPQRGPCDVVVQTPFGFVFPPGTGKNDFTSFVCAFWS